MLFALHDITKTYGKITALRGLSVAVPPRAVGLLGPNGAGKTTLIRALLGLITIDAGSGEVLGLDLHIQRLAIRQAVGFVPEDECLLSGRPWGGFRNLCRRAMRDVARRRLQRAHEVLNHVDLGEARYRPVESYAAGMKQPLKLASALVHDPRLLILDEPTNGMDPRAHGDARFGPRPGPRQADEPALLQPPAAGRRIRLRPRPRVEPGQVGGSGGDPGARTGTSNATRSASRPTPGLSPAALPRQAAR